MSTILSNKKNPRIRSFNIDIVLILITILILCLLVYWYLSSSERFLDKTIELIGTLIVTFLGVYISFSLTTSEEKRGEQTKREKLYTNGLKLIYSELTISEETVDTITKALKAMPDTPSLLYENYTFLIEMSKGVRTKNFDNLIGSDTINEILENDEVINCLQQAYYNLEKATSGLALSREVFIMFKDRKTETISQAMLQTTNNLINQELNKFSRTAELLKKAEKCILEELNSRGVTFNFEK